MTSHMFLLLLKKGNRRPETLEECAPQHLLQLTQSKAAEQHVQFERNGSLSCSCRSEELDIAKGMVCGL